MTRTEAAAVIDRGLQITGNTYAHKDAIRARGCAWNAAKKAWYAPSEEVRAACQGLVDGTLYNSPPPADLTGDKDPASLAAKHGRVAVAGAKVVSFSCYGLDKSDDGKPNGSIRTVKGVRYVQVARTKRVYCSRDWLEDMDLFDRQAGGHYTWDGVAVEPTDGERKADGDKKAKADAAAAAPAAWKAAVAKIAEEVSARPIWVSDTTRVATWGQPEMCHTGSYPVLHIGESQVYYHVPSYFACDWDYPAVHRVVDLTPELRAEILAAIAACKQHGLLRS